MTQGLAAIRRFLSFDPVAHGSSWPTEIMAGLTTFGAMGYIIVVNPAILSATGASRADMIVVTALAAMAGSLLMAFLSRLPIALAPGMGSNVVFAQVVVVRMGLSYGTALSMVMVGAILFVLLSMSQLRHNIVRGFPETIRIGLQGGIGLFIAYLGLRSGGLVTADHAGNLGLGDLRSPAVLLVFLSVLITPALIALRVRGAFLLSIAFVTVAGLFVPTGTGHVMTVLPDHLIDIPRIPRTYLFAFDDRQFIEHFFLVLPITLYFFLSDFFSATATMIAVTRRAGLMDEHGGFPNARRAYLADGLASVIGACLGSPTVGAYVESAAGVEMGGRTGATTLVVALLFGASAFFWPLITVIPPQATAAALVMVGVLMMEGLGHLDMSRPIEAVPAVLILLLTVATTNLMIGLCSGCFVYTVMAAAMRDWKRLTPVFLLTDVLLIVYLILMSSTTG